MKKLVSNAYSLKTLGAFLVPCSLTACATLSPVRKVNPPIILAEYFVACLNLDGSTRFQIPSKYYPSEIIDADWKSDHRGSWILQSYSPLGQTLFQVDFDRAANNLLVSPTSNPINEQFGVSRDGIVTYDGYELGIKGEEVPCLLKGRWPREWLSLVADESVDSTQNRYVFQDKFRTLTLKVNSSLLKNKGLQWQLDIKWTKFIGLLSYNIEISKGLDDIVYVRYGKDKDLALSFENSDE